MYDKMHQERKIFTTLYADVPRAWKKTFDPSWYQIYSTYTKEVGKNKEICLTRYFIVQQEWDWTKALHAACVKSGPQWLQIKSYFRQNYISE